MSEPLVVVGVDGSPASYTALRWTLAYAGRTGARVHAVRCWMPVVARRWEAAVTAEPVPPPAEQEARAERELAEVVAAALARVPDGITRVGQSSTQLDRLTSARAPPQPSRNSLPDRPPVTWSGRR